VAEKVADELGTTPEVLLAQWGLETAWGKSVVPGTNNLGNIKDFSGKGVTAVDNATKSTDKYRAYASVEEFGNDFVSLVKRRYPQAVGKKSAVEFASALKAGGYAEDKDYVAKIAQLAGQPVPKIAAAYDAAIDKSRYAGAVPATDPAKREADLAEVRFQQAVQEEARPTGIEMFGAAMAGNTTNSIFGAIFKDRFEPVEGFKPDMKNLPKGWDTDLADDYGSARSPEEAAAVLQRHQEEQARIKAVMDNGTAPGMALMLGGEIADPLNWAVPWGAARAIGRPAQVTMGGAIAENLVGGTALEATKQALQGDFRPADLAISLVADSLIGVAQGALGMRAAEQLIERGSETALERTTDYARRAEQQLGQGASTSELRQVMQELEAKDLNEVISGAMADVPTERKLIVDQEPPASMSVDMPQPKAVFESPETAMWTEIKYKSRTGSKYVEEYTGGTAKTFDELAALPPGVHTSPTVTPNLVLSVRTAEQIAKKFLDKDTVITIHAADVAVPWDTSRKVNAIVNQVNPKIAMIRVNPDLPAEAQLRATVHEMGHVIFNQKISVLTPTDKDKLAQAFTRFVDKAVKPDTAQEARAMRYSVLDGNAVDTAPPTQAYDLNWDEFSAEQFSKFLAEDVASGANAIGLSGSAIRIIKRAIEQVLEFLRLAKREDIPVSQEYREFFESLIQGTLIENAPAPREVNVPQMSVTTNPAGVVDELMTDPDAVRFGINLAPVSTPAERKQAQAMLALHKRAEQWAAANPMDGAWMKRAKNLADNQVFNVASTGLQMLTSPSPLVRMIATNLVEDASGVAGKRKATAAISKHMTERLMMGNAINDVQRAYDLWSAKRPGVHLDNWNGGKIRKEFDLAVAAEIEARRTSSADSTDEHIKAAADSLQAAYQRIADAQRKVNTLGSEGLPKTSRGYMPHRMSPKAVMNLTNEQGQILHSALVDQFVTIEGWDMSFSDKLATAYMKRIRDRAAGDYGSNVGGGASHVELEEALRGMDLPQDVIDKHMASFTKGAAGFTKGRIELDLNKVYTTSAGEFRLMDIFETNQLELLRSQAGRASGEVALTKFGVRGKPGAKLLRDAMQYGADGQKALNRDLESFDQVTAEFFNEPFGGHTGKFVERAMAANSLVRLGGIVYNQFAESINGIVHVGAANAMRSVAGIPRLRAEIIALAKGEKVDNGLLQSIEQVGGAEFGTDSYKFVMPFDSPDHAYPTYGQDTVTMADRLLRGGGYLQGKLSGWRLIHSAQQRGMAEQIVHKMARYLRDSTERVTPDGIYIREGKEDVALEQFGINAEVRTALRGELDKIAKWDGGRLVEWDVTKISNPDIREQVIQAVWRGTAQIIQGTYIGERGKWAHDGLMKLLTQFRTFSITSMEKQWGRQRNSRGKFAAAGIVLGAMSLAAPIYMARTYVSSIGRPDQEAYLEERLAPQHIARATMNYVAGVGMAGDFLDLISATLPTDIGIKPTGGRAGVETEFVGNYIAPSLSLVDDAWNYVQSPLSLEDATRILPGKNLPYLVPILNAAKE
jgi:hypothetical protein